MGISKRPFQATVAELNPVAAILLHSISYWYLTNQSFIFSNTYEFSRRLFCQM